MDGILDQTKCMASLAVFRELYSKEHDIYNVIGEFIKQIYADHNIRSIVSICDIYNHLKNDYGFSVPTAVVQSSLKRIKGIKVSNDRVFIADDFIGEYSDVHKTILDNQIKNEKILDDFISYVEEKKDNKLNEEEITKAKRSFCCFMIDEHVISSYSEYVSLFIVQHRNNPEFLQQIDSIREGLLIFVGLNYQSTGNQLDVFDTDLHIYLETEILFNLVGYNGVLAKIIFDEFYEQLNLININSKKKYKKDVIHLHYFEETASEINEYFIQAESLIRNNRIPDPDKSAMKYIVNSCRSPYQVAEMKVQFWKDVHNLGITKDLRNNYYDNEEYYALTIEHEKFLKDKTETEVSRIYKSLKLLNYINIKRGARSFNLFRSIGHILLTGNATTRELAMSPDLRRKGTVPLATTITFLTNRFWFTLNKGLSPSMNLKSFNIIARAQLAIASHISNTIGKLYDEIREKFKAGKLCEEDAKNRILELRSRAFVTEDIDVNTLDDDDCLNIIQNDSLEKIEAEYACHQQKEKELQKVILKERDEAIEILNKYKIQNDILIEHELGRMTEESKRKYINESNLYQITKHKAVKRSYIKRLIIAIASVVLYCSSVLCLFLFSKSTKGVSTIVAFLIFFIPFIRPIVDHTRLKESFKLLFVKHVRCQYKEDCSNEYDMNHKQPELETFSREEVVSRILSLE